MLQRDLDVIFRTRNSIFCPSFPETGPCNTDEGVRCVPGERRMWKMKEGAARARFEWVFFLFYSWGPPGINLALPLTSVTLGKLAHQASVCSSVKWV